MIEIFPIYINLVCWPSFFFLSHLLAVDTSYPDIHWICQNRVIKLSVNFDFKKNIFISGACFLRTDQMDGETDWKLRLTVPPCQRLPCDDVSEIWVWNEVLLIRKRHDCTNNIEVES